MHRRYAVFALVCAAWLPLGAAVADEAAAITPIDQQELLAYLAGKADFVLVDARSAEEFAAGHIYKAVSVPHDALAEHRDALPEDLAAPIVVYCRSGQRATSLQSALQAEGFTNVRVLGPTQMIWSDTLPIFNCGVPQASAESFLPVDR